VRFRRLVRAGFSVSEIGFGCEQLGGTDWGEYDVAAAARAVGRAADLGVNLFDTANVYGLGASERALGEALGARRRDMIIVTKGGVCWDDSRGGRARTYIDLSAGSLRTSVESSLQRLGLDSIPLFLLHWPDPRVPLEETLDAIARLKREGKLQAYGLSNFPLEDVRLADSVLEVTAIELRHNLLDRKSEADLIPFCLERGIGVLAYGPLAEGLLADKYRDGTGFGADDRRSRLPHFQAEAFREGMRMASRARTLGEKIGATPAQVAINWVLSNPALSSAIVGAKTERQIEDAARSADWTLGRWECEWLTRSLAEDD
jgi:aryl-alcohol dehydrogenase-like predicted oxidoreductase